MQAKLNANNTLTFNSNTNSNAHVFMHSVTFTAQPCKLACANNLTSNYLTNYNKRKRVYKRKPQLCNTFTYKYAFIVMLHFKLKVYNYFSVNTVQNADNTFTHTVSVYTNNLQHARTTALTPKPSSTKQFMQHPVLLHTPPNCQVADCALK